MPVLFWMASVNGQPVGRIEYFFDDDPGYGQGTAVTFTPGNEVTASFTFSTAGLSRGIHFLLVRTMDSEGKWGTVSSAMILVPDPGPGIPVTRMEYFVDTDPGYGNGTAVTIVPGQNVNAFFPINPVSMAPGMHFVTVRAMDESGRWSVVSSDPYVYLPELVNRPVTRLEYFMDADPGYGNGTGLSITPGMKVSAFFPVNPASPEPGMHFISVRAMDDNRRWSVVSTYPYVHLPDTMSRLITRLEYFIDHDPGYGMGVNVPVAAGDRVEAIFFPDTDTLSGGMHFVHVRAMNADRLWSIVQTYLFFHFVGQPAPVTSMEYFIDQDPGYGSGHGVTITPSNAVEANFRPDTNGLQPGTRRLSVRAHDGAGRWSIVQGTDFSYTSTGRTWTGAVSDDWNVAGNWSPEGVPGWNDDVVIPAGTSRMPVVRTPRLSCRDLFISAGAEIRIDPGLVMTVNGNLVKE